ncbi:hypothetical protein cce_2008 [Crocosphaera subtropica ATCC 51142]|uniref:Uncharacterized protein n=1 Tax=Crocosphaera subtropica (strain ATCC 51142 / BH68) TaxID=43989 RepID=B1X1C9_CROS5|nr:hypothetical protein cce_2008 [Crocosphaera subtropica ATCC 51142]
MSVDFIALLTVGFGGNLSTTLIYINFYLQILPKFN